jgi:hypothetical protein
LTNCEPIFRKLAQPQQSRGSLVNDIASLAATAADSPGEDHEDDEDDEDSKPLSNGIRVALSEFITGDIPRRATFLPSFRLNGRLLTPVSTHSGNGSVVFQSSTDDKPVPGCIESIFKLRASGTDSHFITLRRRKSLDLGNRHDPFAQFPIFDAKLWSCDFEPLEVYPLKVVRCHSASCPITTTEVVVLSLDRVSGI